MNGCLKKTVAKKKNWDLKLKKSIRRGKGSLMVGNGEVVALDAADWSSH